MYASLLFLAIVDGFAFLSNQDNREYSCNFQCCRLSDSTVGLCHWQDSQPLCLRKVPTLHVRANSIGPYLSSAEQNGELLWSHISRILKRLLLQPCPLLLKFARRSLSWTYLIVGVDTVIPSLTGAQSLNSFFRQDYFGFFQRRVETTNNHLPTYPSHQ